MAKQANKLNIAKMLGKEEEHEHEFEREHIEKAQPIDLYYNVYENDPEPTPINEMPRKEQDYFDYMMMNVRKIVSLQQAHEISADKKDVQVEAKEAQTLAEVLTSWKVNAELRAKNEMAMIDFASQWIYDDGAYLEVELVMERIRKCVAHQDLLAARKNVCEMLSSWSMVVDTSAAEKHASTQLGANLTFWFMKERRNRYAVVFVINGAESTVVQHFYLHVNK